MNFNLESVKYFISKNAFIIIALSILGIYLLPYYYNIENSKFLIHDNLDSNVVWYKNLANSNLYFNHFDGIIQNSHGGIKRIFYPTSLNIFYFIYLILPTIKAYCLNAIVQHIIAFLGMYLLSKKYLFHDSKNNQKKSAIFSLCFALIPFWPSSGLSLAGQPLLIYSLLNLQNDPKRFNWLIIFSFPFACSLTFTFFPMCFIFLLLMAIQIYSRKFYKNVNFAVLIFLVITLLIEYRLIQLYFFDNIATQRDLLFSSRTTINFKGLIGISFLQMFKSQYHLFGRIFPIITIIMMVSLIKYNKKHIVFLILTLSLIFTASILDNIRDFSLYKENFMFFQKFNPRLSVLNTILWYIIYAASINKITKSIKYGGVLTWLSLSLIIFSHFMNFFEKDYQGSKFLESAFYNTYINNTKSHNTFKEFYKSDLFKSFKTDFKGVNIICMDILPEIAQYNGLNTLGGYYPIYPLKNCIYFNYLKGDEGNQCSRKLVFSISDTLSNNFSFLDLNANYVITPYLINDINLELLERNFQKKDSLFVYKILNQFGKNK